MFVIIVYTAVIYDNVFLVSKEGKPIIFGSEHSAELYAKENFSLNRKYKIVRL